MSSEHGSMNLHALYQPNSLKPLINSNSIDNIEMNANLNNGDFIHLISFINIHTLSQFNESSYFNNMDGGVENGDVSSGHCFYEQSHSI